MDEFDIFADTPSRQEANVQPVQDETIHVTDRDGNEVEVAKTSAAAAIARELADVQHTLESLESENFSRLEKQTSLKARKAEIEALLDAARKELSEIDNELFDYRRVKREQSRREHELRTNLRTALANEEAAKALRARKVEFDKLMGSGQFAYSDRIMEHQKDGAFILATSMKAILGDKMGAGKTLTSIASWDMNQSQKILVIVPDDVVTNFVREVQYWAPHRNVIQIGKMSVIERQFAFEHLFPQMDSFVAVINYSAWRKDKSLLDKLAAIRFDTVVMDEAHEIKNTSTSAYKGVRAIVLAENSCPTCRGPIKKVPTDDNWGHYTACESCDWRDDSPAAANEELYARCSVTMVTPMTGTVILNKPQDLFALLSLVDPITFREPKDFLYSYCQQDYYTGKWQFRSGGLARLQKELSGKYIARDGVKTPGQHIYNHDLVLDPALYPKQHKVITQLSKHAQILLESGKKMTVLVAIALITRKRQANVWPAGIQLKDPATDEIIFSVGDEVTESIKIDKVLRFNSETNDWEGLLWDLTEGGSKEFGSRVVIFSQFKGPLREITARCEAAGISAVRFDGDTPDATRDLVKIDFDRKHCDTDEYKARHTGGYRWQVVCANYRTGGVGLNFTAATNMILMDREWNPGKENQALGRINRIGQTEETNVHVLRISRTIDTWLDDLISEKEDLIDGFNEVGKDLSEQLLKAITGGEIM